MKFLPWDHYDIQTTLSRDQVVGLFESEVEPRKLLRFSQNHRTFEGIINLEGFKISRIIHYRNSFLPTIHGYFQQGDRGTIIKIKMQLHPFVAVFMCFWFLGVGVGILAVIGNIVSEKELFASLPFSLIPFAMLIFGWLLVSFGFWSEVKKAKVLLNDIVLQNKPKSEQGAKADRRFAAPA